MTRIPDSVDRIQRGTLRQSGCRVILFTLNSACIAIFGSLLFCLDHPAFAAEENNNSFSANIQRSASEIEQLRQALNSPDASTRYAAFAEAVESGRVEMREMAISVGFASADEALQQMAIRAGFIGTTLVAPVITSVDEDPPQNFRVGNLTVKTYDWRTGTINQANAQSGIGRGYGDINSTSIAYLSDGGCTVNMRRISRSWDYRGMASCTGSSYFKTVETRISLTIR